MKNKPALHPALFRDNHQGRSSQIHYQKYSFALVQALGPA
jgi:hypothetical protein